MAARLRVDLGALLANYRAFHEAQPDRERCETGQCKDQPALGERMVKDMQRRRRKS